MRWPFSRRTGGPTPDADGATGADHPGDDAPGGAPQCDPTGAVDGVGTRRRRRATQRRAPADGRGAAVRTLVAHLSSDDGTADPADAPAGGGRRTRRAGARRRGRGDGRAHRSARRNRGERAERRAVGGAASRRAHPPSRAVAEARPSPDLLHAALVTPYTSFSPGQQRPDDAPSELDSPVALTWDPEHGFQRPDGPGTAGLRVVRRRDRSGAPLPDDLDVGGPVDDDDDDRDDRDGPGAPMLRYVPAAGPRVERAPADLVDIVRQATGIDVGGTRDRSIGRGLPASGVDRRDRLHRGRRCSPARRARRRRSSRRAVLAHELTHVAQQRRLGRVMPAEDGPEGVELEAQARDGAALGPRRTSGAPGLLAPRQRRARRAAGHPASERRRRRVRVAAAQRRLRRSRAHEACSASASCRSTRTCRRASPSRR